MYKQLELLEGQSDLVFDYHLLTGTCPTTVHSPRVLALKFQPQVTDFGPSN